MPYCVRTDIENIYGKKNVEKWADLDNDKILVDITARITAMITQADEYIDSRLWNGPWTIPFTIVPEVIKEISAKLTGVKLYEARGIANNRRAEGAEHQLMPFKEEVELLIQRIITGQLVLQGVTHKRYTAPHIVEEIDDDDGTALSLIAS